MIFFSRAGSPKKFCLIFSDVASGSSKAGRTQFRFEFFVFREDGSDFGVSLVEDGIEEGVKVDAASASEFQEFFGGEFYRFAILVFHDFLVSS